MAAPLPMPLIVFTVLAGAVPMLGQAQESPYSGFEQRPIKALSPEEITGYAEGSGMSLALPAELNGYPGPLHVLELADTLDLTDDQRKAIATIFDAMRSQAIVVGQEYIRAEQRLDSLFASGSTTTDDLVGAVEAAEVLKARLRIIHLAAHLETKALMDPGQVVRYQHVRGYEMAEEDHGGHH